MTQTTISIPPGNWNAVGIAKWITEQCANAGVPITVTFDCGRIGFIFDPPADILPPWTTNALKILGFPVDDDIVGYIDQASSQIPIQLSGPKRIHVNTNLPLYTLPPSGRLCSIPVNVHYGQMLNYFDESGTCPALVTSQYIDDIEINLTDENNEGLEGYEEIPWGVILSIEPVSDIGFVPLQSRILNVE